jgi:hypothetical protein
MSLTIGCVRQDLCIFVVCLTVFVYRAVFRCVQRVSGLRGISFLGYGPRACWVYGVFGPSCTGSGIRLYWCFLPLVLFIFISPLTDLLFVTVEAGGTQERRCRGHSVGRGRRLAEVVGWLASASPPTSGCRPERYIAVYIAHRASRRSYEVYLLQSLSCFHAKAVWIDQWIRSRSDWRSERIMLVELFPSIS